MPVRYTSARFVGREEAFAELAAALDDAAHGRTRTVLIDGTAGVGVSRLLDEAIVRIGALREPMTVLRAAAWPARIDEPYGAIVRAIGPTLRGLPDPILADVLGPATSEAVRLLPDLAPRLAAIGASTGGPGTTAPERRQARTLEGILGLLGRLGERHPVVFVIEDLHLADAATRALVTFLARVVARAAAGHRRDGPVGRRRAGRPVVGRSRGDREPAPQPPRRLVIPPLDRDELAALIEGIEDERASASLLLLVAERSGGLPLVAEELLAARRELPSASLTGSFDELVIARLAIRSKECRRVLRLISLAERPLDVGPAGGRGGRVRGRHESSRAALGDRAAVGSRRARRRPVGRPGRGAGQRFPRRGRRRDRVPPPVDRPRRRPRPAARRPDEPPRRARRGPRRAARRGRLALAVGLRPAARPDRGDRGGGLAGSRHAAADELSALETALALPAGTIGTGSGTAPCGRRASDRVDLQVRASEAAFAVGQTSRATAFLESAIGGLDARRDRVRLGLLHERLAQIRRAAGDPAGAMLRGPPRGGARPARREPGARDRAGRTRPAQDARRHLLREPAPRPRRDPRRPRVRPRGAGAGDPRHHDARGRVGVGDRPGRCDRAAARGRASRERDRRSRTRSSGSGPT